MRDNATTIEERVKRRQEAEGEPKQAVEASSDNNNNVNKFVIFDGRKGFRTYENTQGEVLARQFSEPFTVEAYGQDTLEGEADSWLMKHEDGSFEVVSNAEFNRRYSDRSDG